MKKYIHSDTISMSRSCYVLAIVAFIVTLLAFLGDSLTEDFTYGYTTPAIHKIVTGFLGLVFILNYAVLGYRYSKGLIKKDWYLYLVTFAGFLVVVVSIFSEI